MKGNILSLRSMIVQAEMEAVKRQLAQARRAKIRRFVIALLRDNRFWNVVMSVTILVALYLVVCRYLDIQGYEWL